MSISDVLINNWLNNELKFEPKIVNIQKEFRNGYNFGKLLLKLGLISDYVFNLYKVSNGKNDIDKNFSVLEKNLLEILSIKLEKEDIDNIINAKSKYTSVLLIYKIKNSYYKHKIHFSDIKVSLIPMNQNELNQKVKLLFESDNNEEFENSKVDENIKIEKEKIPKPRKIKIHKVTFSSQQKHDIPDEKSFMKKRIILPKIKNSSIIEEQNFDSKLINIKENSKLIENKNLNRNRSELNIINYPTLHTKDIVKPHNEFKYNNRNRLDLKKELLMNSKSVTNIFKEKLNLINAKTLDTNNNNETIPEYNFIKKDQKFLNNILNKLSYKQNSFVFLERNFVLYDTRENSKYKSAFKRKEYSDICKKENEKKIIIKRMNNFNNLFHKLEIAQKQKKQLSSSTDLINKINQNEKKEFNYNQFFKEVDKLNLNEFNKYCEKKYKNYKRNYKAIKSLVLLILNVTMEGYIYQAETKKDLIDIPFYLKLIKLFLKNKKLKRKYEIDEFKQIKEVGKIDEKIDFNKMKLHKDDLYFLKDYSYYIGFWNRRRILDNEILGKRLDYKLLFSDDKKKVEEYEPTEMEHDDLTFPTKLINNFDFGEFITEFIDHKYSQIEKSNNNNNEEDKNQMTKWFYIQYKIALVGQSFIGNKYLAQHFNKKYPNLKIYCVHKLLNDYCSYYKKLINEPEQKTSKAKTKKNKNDKNETSKKQKEENLEDFQPILNIIKPYFEQLEQNNKESPKNDLKNNSNLIPQDELLLKLLIYQIEKDFPLKTKKEFLEEEKEKNNKINNLLDKIEEIKNNLEQNEKEREKEKKKEKKGSKKDKDEKSVENLEKELDNIKSESIKGFILVDFPNNINQCHLLENYLTGYIEDIQKPKSLKNIEIRKLNEIIDIEKKPKTEQKLKTSGLDYLINLSSKEGNTNALFKNIQYDPIEDIIYSKLDSDILTDKKLIERLIDKVYYYDNNTYEYYKKEYEENISKINLFYDKFGIYLDTKNKRNHNDIFVSFGKNVIESNTKALKVYQAMTISDINQEINLNTSINKETKKNKKLLKNSSIRSNKSAKSNKEKKEKEKVKEKEKENKEQNDDKTKNNNLSPMEIYKITTKNINEFFSLRIEALYDYLDKRNTLLVKYNGEFDVNRISDIKRGKTKKTLFLQEKDKIIYNLKSKSQELINSIISLDENYNTDLKYFIYLLLHQRKEIFNRFNLIQKKFRDYLNRETIKKKVIHKYVVKYNDFYDSNKDLLSNQNVQKEFMSDIEFININLWQIINLKKKESIAELNAIKNCGYIEVEMCKFFNNIKQLFYIETSKYIKIINTLIDFYMRYFINDKASSMRGSGAINIGSGIGSQQNKYLLLKEEINNNLKINENILFKDLIPFEEILRQEKEENIEELRQNLNNPETYNKGNKTEYSLSLNKKMKMIEKNVNIIFFNSIKFMMSENEAIVPFLKLLSEINNVLKKKITLKAKKTTVFSSNISSQNSNIQNNKERTIISEDYFKKIIKNEKDKLKYRLCFIKSFAKKYITIISKLSLKIFNNADEWVIKSILKENETQNEVVNILKNKLKQMERIDEVMEIGTIEMDSFVKRFDDEEINNSKISDTKIRPIDNTSVITNNMYNKLNIDFLINDNFFDIKLEQIEKEENNSVIKDNLYDYINDIKEYDIIMPITTGNYIGNNYIMSEKSNFSNEDEIIKEEDFYYDIDKFFYIYKEILQYEAEKNIISYDNFFEVFIKNYIIKDNEEIVKYEYNAISNNLKKINIKQILRLIDLCKIYFEKKNDDKNIEYETYIKTNQIFTLLSLMGARIMTGDKENEILKYFDDKFINGKYVHKNEFMKYHFWFEKYFDYQRKNNVNNDIVKKYNEIDIQMTIKDLLLELWNDGNDNINLKQLLEILKMSNYITDFVEYNGIKYFDAIFFE